MNLPTEPPRSDAPPPEPPRREDPPRKTSVWAAVGYTLLILIAIPVGGVLLLFGTCLLGR